MAICRVLRKHMESPSAAARACIAINTLAMVGGNARWFGPAGVCDVLQSALVLHINDLKVAKFIIAAIGQLCVIEHNKERLGSLGICETVVQAAVKHVADLDTAQSCADTIGKLCETIVKNTSVSAAAGTAASASKVAAATYSSVPVETLKASSHFEAGRLNRAVLFSCGACEFLVSALDHHLVHVSAAYCISRAVYLVSQGEACFQERERLGQLGACQAVTKALLYHEGNEEVAMYGCYAVQALALDSEHNKHVLNEAGVCPVVVQTLRGYRHSPTGSGATEAAGRAINNMSMGCAENKLSLGSAGACEGLLEVLELFNRSVDLTLLFVKALFNVCDGNSINRVKISFSGAGDILHAVLQRYIDEERVVDYVLSILIGMSMDKVGQSKLGTAGVPKTLAVLAGRYEKTSEHILVLLVVLIGVMARNSRANQEKLAQSGAFKIILSALARHSAQQGSSSLGSRSKLTGMMVRSKTLTTITSSDSFYDNSRSRAPTSTSVDLGISGEAPQDSLLRDDGDASEALLPSKQIGDTSLLEYMEEVSMVKEACRATFYLCYEHEENKKRATVAGVLDILTAIVSNSSGTAGDMLQSTQDQQKLWAKNAMELLMISS
ncbi:hypothetical protein EON64_01715 [archaeon]|nr:MAG: hypothetical protein EON64_01715 [archaeon]